MSKLFYGYCKMFWDRTIFSYIRSLSISEEYHGKIHSAKTGPTECFDSHGNQYIKQAEPCLQISK